MRKYLIMCICLVLVAGGVGCWTTANAMAEEAELQETAEAQVSSSESAAENRVEDKMNAKAQKTKKIQEEIKKEQVDRMIKDTQKGMLR